ncbi:MAG: twin transmembrane helix small protein [Gammaproteobacteria bacterium]|nr:twin transmembrane helix small protein [Gammaproteobacteria bacterium]
MKIVVIVLLLAIVASLATGLYHLSRKDHDSTKVLGALKVRVALSLLLIVFLVASYYLGWING